MKFIPYKELEPENTNLYDNGTPFDKPELIYREIVGESIPLLKDRQPVAIVVIGGQSTGKTTLLFLLSDIYNYYYGKPLVDMANIKNPQYSQGGTEFLNKLPLCQEGGYPCHIWDESGKYSRKNTLSSFNKNLDEAMDVLRVYQTALLIARHDIHRIPKEMIDHEIIGLLIRCKKRRPGSGYVEAEVYDFQAITHIINQLKSAIAPQYIFNKKVYPNFHFRFKDLSPERSEILNRISSNKKKDMWAGKDIQAQGLLSISEIHIRVDRSIVWIKKKIKELKIESKLTHKRKNYYSEDTILKLQRKMK